MSTHRTRCIICEEDCYCTSDTHALGCGDGCYSQPTIEFCSLACAEELQGRLAKRIALYKEMVSRRKPAPDNAVENPFGGKQ